MHGYLTGISHVFWCMAISQASVMCFGALFPIATGMAGGPHFLVWEVPDFSCQIWEGRLGTMPSHFNLVVGQIA